jgi:hypothetical protein
MDEQELESLIELPRVTDPEIRRMLGIFDVPAFARRGQELAEAREALRLRCRKQVFELQAMVRLRLRQWAAAATGFDDWRDVWDEPIAKLWEATRSPAPTWAPAPAPRGRRESVARDLVATIKTFNRRWLQTVQALDLEPVNRLIKHYNAFYLLEKECSLGSPRLAARGFQAELPVSHQQVLEERPFLPVPSTR